MEYKGYYGTVEYSQQDDCLFGKIVGINSLYLYEGTNIKELKKDFEQMVDSYLETCKKSNVLPDKPYKGSFNVRMSPELHKEAALYSLKNGITLNSLVERSVQTYLMEQQNNNYGFYVSDNAVPYKAKKKKNYQS